MKGNDLKAFIITPKIALNFFISYMPPSFVITSNTPIGNPSNSENIVERNTIYIVSTVETASILTIGFSKFSKRGSIKELISIIYHLHYNIHSLHKLNCFCLCI